MWPYKPILRKLRVKEKWNLALDVMLFSEGVSIIFLIGCWFGTRGGI